MEGGNKLGGGAIYNTMVLVFLKKGQRFLRDEEVTSHLRGGGQTFLEPLSILS